MTDVLIVVMLGLVVAGAWSRNAVLEDIREELRKANEGRR